MKYNDKLLSVLNCTSNEEVCKIFDRRSDLENLANWLDSSSKEKTAVTHLAERTSCINNGFIRLHLAYHVVDKPDIRLHVWPKGEPSETDFHSHPWDFSCLVIAGSIDHEIYHLTPGAKYIIFRYEETNEQNRVLSCIGECDLTHQIKITAADGSKIKYDRTVTHKIRNSGTQLTMTLVSRTLKMQNYSLIYKLKNQDPPNLRPPQKLSVDETQMYLALAAKELKVQLKKVN